MNASPLSNLEEQDPIVPESDPQAAMSEENSEPDAQERMATRRQLFRLGAAALAAAAIAPRDASAQRIVRPHTTRPKAPPAPIGDSLLRLVRRATFGVTEEEYARAKSMGFNRWLEYQLKYTSIDDSEVDTVMATRYPNLALNGDALFQQDQNLLMNQLIEGTMWRATFSKRQLYERMVHFWTDHFTVYYQKVNYLKLIDDREVIRKHALGKFPDLLRASAHSPAMLAYLDNTQSRVGNVNENYAREIMELHTLGVDGGYTQTDVAELTRILTGWTIAGRYNFAFVPTSHDFAAKTWLGTTFPAAPGTGMAGQQEGETALNTLVNHPNTAKFIATKMIRWLLQYDPPAALVTKVAATYTRTGGDIPSMIRDILTPANLMAAPAKYRQPYQMVVAALRATRAIVTNIQGNRGSLNTLGQPLFQWEDPDGFPDNVDWWAGTILLRWNYLNQTLLAPTSGAIVVDVTPLMTSLAPGDIADAINRRAFVGEMPADLKARITAYLAAGGATVTQARVREAFALALSSSAFQWY
jgi:uncharacterized protein (DUF1800 family)